MAPARERHSGAQHGPGGDAMSDRKAACEGGEAVTVGDTLLVAGRAHG